MWVSFIEIIVNVALSVMFIKLFGVVGVAYATVIAFTTEKIVLVTLVKLKLKIALKDYLPIGIFSIYSIFAVIIYVIVDFYLFK